MTSADTAILASADGTPLLIRRFPGGRAQGPVMLVGHGPTVHSGLLAPACRTLAEGAAAVWAGDLRGHGGSVSARAPLAHLDPATGWQGLREDMAALARAAFRDVPRHRRILAGGGLSGHVMLDLVARDPGLAGHLVMAGPTPRQPTTNRIGMAFLRMRMLTRAHDQPDPQCLHHLYGFLRAQLPPGTDDLDTISAEPEVIRMVRDDPRGFPTPTLGYWRAVLDGVFGVWDRVGPGDLSPDLRVLILSGPDDPQSRGGRLVPGMLDWFRDRGVSDASARLIDGVRANVLIDAPHLPVAPAILDWFAGQSGGAEAPPPAPVLAPAEAYAPVLERMGLGEAGRGALTIPTLIDLCYAALEDDSRWIELIYRLVLGAEDEGFEAERLLEAVFPHWQRAFELREELRRAAALGQLYDDLIDRLDLGVAVLDEGGGLRHANAAFGRALDRIAPGMAAQVWLRRVLPVRMDGADVPVLHAGEAVGVAFVPASLRAAGTGGRLVVLRAREAGLPDLAHRAGLLSLAYGLTGQEGVAALHLAEGLSTTACAQRMGITENTLRSHLKQVFDKMGVASRSELAARVLSGPLGWLASKSAPPSVLPPGGG